MRTIFFFCVFLACLAPGLSAQTFTPSMVFSVHDEPVDGLGDTFNSAPFTGMIRSQNPRRADRALEEFDLSSLAGVTISSATLNGRVAVNNAYNNGVRSFDFSLYPGNGQQDLSDYQIAGTVVGSGSYQPPTQSSFSYSFDVTADVQTLLSVNTTWIGLRCQAMSDPSFPNILDDTVSQLVIVVGAPWTMLGGGLAGTNGTPALRGTGTLQPGSPAALDVSGGLPSTAGILLIGFQPLNIPLLGGTLVPSPDVLASLGLDASGAISLPFTVPRGVPTSGVMLYHQVWLLDPGGPQSFAATNGLRADFP